MEPEYILEESEKMLPTEKPLDCTNLNYQQVKVDLVQLFQQLSMAIDILGKILDSVHVLEQSLGEQQ